MARAAPCCEHHLAWEELNVRSFPEAMVKKLDGNRCQVLDSLRLLDWM